MQTDQTNTVISNTNQPYTILRIKRKRNEEPLDALVVESLRRKKSRGIGVFRYAETVEDGVWDDAQKQRDIQEKISRLAQETVPKPETKLTTDSTTDNVPSFSPVVRRDENTRRYTIIEHEDPKVRHKRIRTTPPEVHAKGTETRRKSAIDFRMYDAVLANQKLMAKDQASTELDKFLPLLNDYLKIHDINPSDDVRKENIKAVTDDHRRAVTSNNDYVWDVFYHRPTTLSAWNAAAAKVGMLTGLPSDFEGYDSTSDSDDEFLDEADEDSNAEEYYKNDYPDEDDGSDEYHEDSDYDSIVHYHDSEDDFD